MLTEKKNACSTCSVLLVSLRLTHLTLLIVNRNLFVRYVISNILLAARRPLCSVFLLRLTNFSYTFIILFTVSSLLKTIHPHLTRQERLNSAAVIICFPVLWFFNFLYYTDGGSSAFILLSWLAAKKRHHFFSALVSTYSSANTAFHFRSSCPI